MVLLWIAALSAVPLIWGIIIYNRLVTLRNDLKGAWSQIDVQLKRRYDLIPNLVSAVRGYLEHEKDVIERVVSARSRAMAAQRLKEKASAEDGLSDSLSGLFAVVENYPLLRASDNVMQLQEELVSTENRIAFARQLYNDLVANYMTRREIIPDSFIASVFSFMPYEYFRASPSDRQVPDASAGR